MIVARVFVMIFGFIVFLFLNSCGPYYSGSTDGYFKDVSIRADLRVNPERYSGACPVTLRFDGNIRVTNLSGGPITVNYRFIRSDGASSPHYTHTLYGDGVLPVNTTWRLGSSDYGKIDGWVSIMVVKPYSVESNRAYFTVECRGGEKPGDSIREDCVSLDPSRIEVKNISGRWKIVDGNRWIFDFADKRSEAEQTLRIIKYFGMNQSCFIGRPHPSFSYLLVSGQAPKGELLGEDCVSFNPYKLEVVKSSGRWKISDGSRFLFDFGNKEEEARQALMIIRNYGFKKACYVGRPEPSFMYLKK